MPSRLNQTFPSRFAQSGFGLVELMITVAILAILAAMAFPSYNYMIRGNRVSTEANDFLSALNYARNESITRTRGVTLCAADTTGGSTPTACGGSTVWTKGWMVFIDDTAGATTPTAIDPAAVLRTWIGNPHNTLLPNAAQTFVRFNPRGLSAKLEEASTSPPLLRYGFTSDAKRIAMKWLSTNLSWFNEHGVFLEKYNVVNPDKPPAKGVYPSQTGFGWTNAVFEYFCKEFIDR